MSLSLRLFPTYPAKPAFGVNVAVQNAGDYLSQKKAKEVIVILVYANK